MQKDAGSEYLVDFLPSLLKQKLALNILWH